MAFHAFWKGYLKLSLVTCPVALIPATTDSERIRFHTLNRKTGARVVSRYVDEETGKPVEDQDEAKGYARGESDYLVLEDEELEAVRLESARTIDIASFAAADSIDWVWYETPFYLVPDDPVGEEAYCVIRDAMRATGMIGVSSLVLFRRERAVVLSDRGKGLVLWTLRYGNEVRDPESLFGRAGDKKAKEKAEDPELLKLVRKLIDERKSKWSPDLVRDPVQERLAEIISEKKKGLPPRKKTEEGETSAPPSNVVNIMEALRRSVASAPGPAKSRTRKR
jgi:DNA end-binding protein Ku